MSTFSCLLSGSLWLIFLHALLSKKEYVWSKFIWAVLSFKARESASVTLQLCNCPLEKIKVRKQEIWFRFFNTASKCYSEFFVLSLFFLGHKLKIQMMGIIL